MINALSGVLNGLAVAQGASSAFGALRAPGVKPLKKAALFLYHGIHAKGSFDVLAGKTDYPLTTNRDHVTPTDALLLASSILGPAFKQREQEDFKKWWRFQMDVAISQYMPPQGGMKRMLLDLVDHIPLFVHPEYKSEFERLERLYAHADDDKALRFKRQARTETFHAAVRAFQGLSFRAGTALLNGEHQRIQFARVCLIHKSIEFTPGLFDGEGPALITPTSLSTALVMAEIPDIFAYVSVNHEGYRWQHLPSAFESAQNSSEVKSDLGASVDIAYFFEPTLTTTPPTQ